MTSMTGGGLPPSIAITRAAIKAAIQDIGVRLIALPDELANNPSPIKLDAVVLGTTPDGMTKLQTERGIITMLMKDKASLPQGQKIEIDIPAGRPPAQAAIRSAPVEASQPPPTAPVSPLQSELTEPQLQIHDVRLPRDPPFKSGDVVSALEGLPAVPETRSTSPLQVGQTIRLIPLSPQASPPTQGLSPIADLFVQLVNFVSQDTELPTNIRQTLIENLLRLDISSFTSGTASSALMTDQLKKIGQAIEALRNISQAVVSTDESAFENDQSRNLNLPVISSSRSLDAKVLSFVPSGFQEVLQAVKDIPDANGHPRSQFAGLASVEPALTRETSPPAVLQTALSPKPLNPQPPQGQILLGQMAGFTADGLPVVTVALPRAATAQTYVMQFPADNLQPGSPVMIETIPSIAIPRQIGSAPFVSFAIGDAIPLADWVKPGIWDSFQDLIQTATHLNPALGQALGQILPNAVQTQNVPPLAMLFLAVIRSGDFDDYLPQPILNLIRENGKTDILRSLAGEAAKHARLENTILPNDWRATMLPFYHEQQIHKLPLYYKKMQDEDAGGERKRRNEKMRFLFNLQLSRMGNVQVDGFVQPKRLDMILRTKAAVSVAMQQALKGAYTKALDRSNLTGELGFQFKPEQWVNIEMPLEAIS